MPEIRDYLNLMGNRIGGVGNAINADEAVNLAQLTAALYGLDQKPSVRVVATSNVTLSGLQTIDGVATVSGDRVFTPGQTNAAQRLTWIASSGNWTIAPDFAQGYLTSGAFIDSVEEGSAANVGSQWLLTTPNPITVLTTGLSWTQVNKPFTYSQGTGITITGNQIAIDTNLVPRIFNFTIGDGSNSSFVISFTGSGKRGIAQVSYASTGEVIIPGIKHNATNTNITLTINPVATTNQFIVSMFT